MKAMVLDRITELTDHSTPLRLVDWPRPDPGENAIRIAISVCGVCHTELDEIEGRTPPPRFPIILGHEIVGHVDGLGPGAKRFSLGDRVGVGWIHTSCGGAAENLAPEFRATGRDVDGGYAEFTTVPERYAYPIPESFTDAAAAPLLCAGGVGYRALKLAAIEDRQRFGLMGFGGSAHLVLQLVQHLCPNSEVYVFARDRSSRRFARDLGAFWAGDITDRAPAKLDAIIDTTPVWRPVVEALANLRPSGRLVINAIRKRDTDKRFLLELDYAEHLWLEKEIKTVANVTGRDIETFLPIAARIPIVPRVEIYPLEDANRALSDLKAGNVRGAKVLMVRSPLGA